VDNFIIHFSISEKALFNLVMILGSKARESELKINNNGIGKYDYNWRPKESIKSGVYFVSLMIDGIMAQTTKIVLNR
jgi:hypothetical protein